jgi:hypothetical protein
VEKSGFGHDGKVELGLKVLELWSNSGRKKQYRRRSGLRVSSVPPRLAGLFWIFGHFLVPVIAVATESPLTQIASSKPPSNESLLINGRVVIALSLAYTAMVSNNRLSTVTIIALIGVFLLGMDDNISNWQLTFCCVFSGSLIFGTVIALSTTMLVSEF